MDPLFCPECGEAVEVLAYDPENADYDILICPGCDAQGWRCTIASLDEPDEEPGEDFHLDARALSGSEFETDPDDRQYDDCDIDPRDYDLEGPL